MNRPQFQSTSAKYESQQSTVSTGSPLNQTTTVEIDVPHMTDGRFNSVENLDNRKIWTIWKQTNRVSPLLLPVTAAPDPDFRLRHCSTQGECPGINSCWSGESPSETPVLFCVHDILFTPEVRGSPGGSGGAIPTMRMIGARSRPHFPGETVAGSCKQFATSTGKGRGGFREYQGKTRWWHGVDDIDLALCKRRIRRHLPV